MVLFPLSAPGHDWGTTCTGKLVPGAGWQALPVAWSLVVAWSAQLPSEGPQERLAGDAEQFVAKEASLV